MTEVRGERPGTTVRRVRDNVETLFRGQGGGTSRIEMDFAAVGAFR
jgi:hypothetical protein